MTKYYTIYEITNIVNGMIYIGHHTTFNLNDKYMGSGREITKAVNEFGIENFKKEILFIYDNKDEMIAKEIELVNDEFRKREDTYNLALGGGCFGMLGVKLSEETCKKMSESHTGVSRVFSKRHCQSLKKSKENVRWLTHPDFEKDIHIKGEFVDDYLKLGWKIGRRPQIRTKPGKPHTEESKQKNRAWHLGRKQSPETLEKKFKNMIGRVWIMNHELQKTRLVQKAEIDDLFDNGWVLGRGNFKSKVQI